MPRILPAAALAAALVFASCGDGSSTSSASYEMARQLSANFSRAQECYGAPDGADCQSAVHGRGTGLAILCLNVSNNGLFEAQLDEDLRGANVAAFADLCAEWQTVQRMAAPEGRETLDRLSEEAARMADRYD